MSWGQDTCFNQLILVDVQVDVCEGVPETLHVHGRVDRQPENLTPLVFATASTEV